MGGGNDCIIYISLFTLVLDEGVNTVEDAVMVGVHVHQVHRDLVRTI